MGPFDKAYVTFVFDDNRMPFTKECFDIFKKYNMPMCCAVIARYIDSQNSCFSQELKSLLLEIQASGGEILSHGYNHIPITSKERALKPVNNYSDLAIYKAEDIDREFRKSYEVLAQNGFDVNGILEVGCGGDERTADYEAVETITRKYYKYSNRYGTSYWHCKSRKFLTTTAQITRSIEKAVANKKWVVISAHEFGNSKGNINRKALINTLELLKNNKDIEVVNWKYMYEKFSVCTSQKNVSEELNLSIRKISVNHRTASVAARA